MVSSAMATMIMTTTLAVTAVTTELWGVAAGPTEVDTASAKSQGTFGLAHGACCFRPKEETFNFATCNIQGQGKIVC